MLAAQKTISKKQYMLNIEEKKNRQDKKWEEKNGERECTTNHLDHKLKLILIIQILIMTY